MEHYNYGAGSTRRITPIKTSHTERVLLGDQPIFSGRASGCANVKTRKSKKKGAKPELNIALRPDSLTYLFTCGIDIRIYAAHIKCL